MLAMLSSSVPLLTYPSYSPIETEMETPSKEESLEAFIGFLVEPIINEFENGARKPFAAAHEEVAKQVQATVLLYNYYHRKQFPHLEFLDALTFCKTAVIMCTKLITYMGILKGTDVLATDFDQHATLTVKMVKEACDICESLNSPRTMPNTDALPISKVAAFIIDASHEKCILSFGSITKGVWSLVEKTVEGFDDFIGGTQEMCMLSFGSMTEELHNREECSRKRSFRCVTNTRGRRRGTKNNGTMLNEREKLQQLAYAAVKQQTGIDQSDLKVFAVRVVYSLSKAKMNCQLYMMRCVKDVALKSARGTQMKWIPVKDALSSSIEGPLLENVSHTYQASSTVSYFHLRPYVNAIRDCLLRKCSINGDRISETFESAQYNKGQISVASDHLESQAQYHKCNSNKKEHMAPKTPCLNDESGKSKSDIGGECIDNGIANTVLQALPAADHYPSQHTLTHAENSIHKPLSHFEVQSTATGKLISTTEDGEDTCKASGQFLDQYSSPADHTFSGTKQVSSTLNCELHNARDMEQDQLDENTVNQMNGSKGKSDLRHHVSVTSKQDICQTEVGANAEDKILYAQSEKTRFTPFQSSEQIQKVGNDLYIDEPIVKGLKFFKRHLRKKQKSSSSNSIITASMESSENSQSDPFLTSSIIIDPIKMHSATVLSIINSFKKQIEQREANHKLENKQLHQKIDSLYKFVRETFAEAINVCEEELSDTSIDKLQVALKNLANNQDIGRMKMNRELLSQYLSIADELEREVNKSFEKLSVATEESFTMFVKLHDWPTLLTMRDSNINQLICEVQQVTSECLNCKTMSNHTSKLQEAQEKTKKIQQWYESCPSIIMQLQNFKDRAEYHWKALNKVTSWSVEETMDIQKEKPESADLAALYCNRFQNLDYRLVQALEEWDHFKKELLNTVPELKSLLHIIK